MKLIKDPLYGYIEIPQQFIEFVDNENFQRLRYIKQLGFTYLLYPNATHNRFSHSLGVFYLTNVFLKNCENEKVKEFQNELLLASLYHDVGHGPFSHTFEYITNYEYNHEEEGIKILESLQDKIEKTMDFKKLIEIFKGKNLGQIITSDLGTDRLDYLKRDSYFTGVNLNLDSHRIVKNIVFRNEELILKEKAIFDAYNLLIVRFLMFKNVYLHRVSFLFDEIFKEAFNLSQVEIEEVKKLTDDELLYFLYHKSNKRVKELIKRIKFRQKPKFHWEIKIKNFEERKIEELKEELKKREINTWVFLIPKSYKEPKIKIENKKLSSSPLIKAIEKEEEKTRKLIIYSDKKITDEKEIKRFLEQ